MHFETHCVMEYYLFTVIVMVDLKKIAVKMTAAKWIVVVKIVEKKSVELTIVEKKTVAVNEIYRKNKRKKSNKFYYSHFTQTVIEKCLQNI